MKFPWANTLLLAFIFVELVSGFYGLVTSSPDEAIFIILHRISGWGILVILLWKSRNILFSLKWKRHPTPRTASLVLLVALVMTLALGFLWSFVGPYSYWLFSGVSWHIYIGAALVPILIWHFTYHTRGFPLTFWADRRSFLRFGGIAIAGVLLWRIGEASANITGLPGSDRRFTGSYEAKNFSGNDFPLTSWLNDRPLPVVLRDWKLSITGAVERELSLNYSDLTADATTTATIDCTGGWHSTQVWGGIPVAALLEKAGLTDEAASVTFTSVTGYYRRFSLAEAMGYLLAVEVGEEALSHGHGFPARLVAPDKRGFEWVKWVSSIEVNKTSKWWQRPLPIQ